MGDSFQCQCLHKMNHELFSFLALNLNLKSHSNSHALKHVLWLHHSQQQTWPEKNNKSILFLIIYFNPSLQETHFFPFDESCSSFFLTHSLSLPVSFPFKVKIMIHFLQKEK